MVRSKFLQYLRSSKAYCYKNTRLLVDSLSQNYLRTRTYFDTLRTTKWTAFYLPNTKSPAILNLTKLIKFVVLAVVSFILCWKLFSTFVGALFSRFLLKSTTSDLKSDKNILPTTISNHDNFQVQVLQEEQLDPKKTTITSPDLLKCVKHSQQITNSLYLLQAEQAIQHLKILANRSRPNISYIKNTTSEVQTLFRHAYPYSHLNLRNNRYLDKNPTNDSLIPFNTNYKFDNNPKLLEQLLVLENSETRFQLEYVDLEKNIAELSNQLNWCKLQQQLLSNNFINNNPLNPVTALTNVKKLLNNDFTESNSAVKNLWIQNNIFTDVEKNVVFARQFNEFLNEAYNYSNTSKSRFYETNLSWYLQKFALTKKPMFLNQHLMPSMNTNTNELVNDVQLRQHLNTKYQFNEFKLNISDDVVVAGEALREEIVSKLPITALCYLTTNRDTFNFNSLLLINLILTNDARETTVNEYYNLSNYWRSDVLSFDAEPVELCLDLTEIKNILNSKADQNLLINTAITQLPEGDVLSREYLKNIYRYYSFMTKK